MKNTSKWFKIIAIGAVIAISLVGCTTNVATAKATSFDANPLALVGDPNYTVLGPVMLEKDWSGIVGFTTASANIPFIGVIPSADYYFFQTGGVTYADLLTKAKEKYPEVDAVVDIKIDYSRSAYWIFYAKRTNIITGIAIKYSRTEVKSKDGRDAKGSINLTF